MAFRTDLAVEAIENHKTAAALPHVRQSDRTLEGFAVHKVRILSEDAAREIGKRFPPDVIERLLALQSIDRETKAPAKRLLIAYRQLVLMIGRPLRLLDGGVDCDQYLLHRIDMVRLRLGAIGSRGSRKRNNLCAYLAR